MAPRMTPAPPGSVTQRILARYPVEGPGRTTLVRMTLSDGQLHRLVSTVRDALRLLW